jgi:hypothetical protein
MTGVNPTEDAYGILLVALDEALSIPGLPEAERSILHRLRRAAALRAHVRPLSLAGEAR